VSTLPRVHLVVRVADVARARGIGGPAALARATGIPPTSARRWWHGRIRVLYLRQLVKLCSALNAQPGDLLVITA
jgi:DNA-binding Xre family transcriptional regulator